MNYTPNPVNTDGIILPDDILDLAELLAENTHEVWASARLKEGWVYGLYRDDIKKEHPCLVPYESLPQNEKIYDRNTVLEALKLIVSRGYQIKRMKG